MSPINKHVHLLEAELWQYVFAEHELSQIQIEHIELELQVCDECSNIYLALLDNMVIPEKPMLTDEKYKQISIKLEQQQPKVIHYADNKRWFEKSVVHFVAAACITGLLFVSGFLSVMTNALLDEEVSSSPNTKIEAKEGWLKVSEPEWIKQLKEQFAKLNQLELFKGE